MTRRGRGRSTGSTIVAWLAAAMAATFLIFGGSAAASVALSSVSSHVETAEDAVAGEETTTSVRSSARARARSARRREPRRTVRWVAAVALRVAPLVVPTAFAPRRGPPLLTV